VVKTQKEGKIQRGFTSAGEEGEEEAPNSSSNNEDVKYDKLHIVQ
jgi:hypothetical protein